MTPLFASVEKEPLAPFEWKHRIILVFCPQYEVEDALKELESDHRAINERHILWFVFSNQSMHTNYRGDLKQSFAGSAKAKYLSGSSRDTQVFLIGKDGGVKDKSTELKLERLYELIDAMPMRQAEMKAAN